MRCKRGKRALALTAAILALIAFAYIFVYPRVLQRMKYPIRYEAQIYEAAAQASVPPALIAAIALTESGYNARALSSQGAMGLMQILPETGGWIAEKLGEQTAFSEDWLYDADKSLMYGSWYLNYLLARYSGDMECAIAAYHAGQGAVDAWLKNADAGNLTIPESAPRTRHYVSKVKAAYEYYNRVYK